MMRILEGSLGLHEQALGLRSRRLEVLARNIANADTPHYKAQDLDFQALLSRVESEPSAMSVTHANHFPVGDTAGVDPLRFRIPFNTSMDGNTVEMSVEQAHYGKAAADYQATLSFLENRVSGLRKALRGD
jgi:flagellar basal-body rod protein FlgB